MELDKGYQDRERLESMPTQELDVLLRTELRAKEPDGALVRMLLQILEDRERQEGHPEGDPKDGTGPREIRKGKKLWSSILRVAASVLVFCGVAFGLPKAVSADNFFQMVAIWSDNIFELFNSEDARGTQVEYAFQTDHPGLQQVYDEAAEMGVTGPGVPMWLPEVYDFKDIKKSETPKRDKLHAWFEYDNSEATFTMEIYSADVSYTYQKDDSEYKEYEYNGVTHYVMKNEGIWTVAWSRDNIVCTIVIECREDVLYRIIDSIYTSEAYE